MNDVQRKLLEDKVKWTCNDCKTVFEGDDEFYEAEEKIAKVIGFKLRNDLEICWNCTYFRDPINSQFQEVAGECTFGCARPELPIGSCKAFKSNRRR